MGWTGDSYREFRCWYITVFPPTLLIILSIIGLVIIVMVCTLYFIILHRAVKTVNEIRAYKELQNRVVYLNNGVDGYTETIVTITLATETITRRNDEQKETNDNNHFKIANYAKDKSVNVTPNKMKAIKMVLLITTCFVGTWAPYYVSVIIYVKCNISVHGYDCVPLEILTLGPLYFLCMCNSLCDPIIYAWWHAGFKHSMRKMFSKCLFNMKIFRR